jgi:RND family efflux transporter MFP subunit
VTPPPFAVAPSRVTAPSTTIALLSLLFAGSCTDTAAKPSTAAPAPTLPLVRVEKAQLREVRREIETTTFLESEHRVVLLSKVSARVLEVPVDEGQVVTKGQLLARLDDREAKSALRQTTTLLEDRRVKAELAELEVEASKRRVEQARLERSRCEADYRRNAEIAEGFIAPKVLEDSRYALDSADQALRVAEFNERKAILDVAAAKNAIEELQAKQEDAQIQLDEHRIVAPFDGVLVTRNVTGGESIGTATELFTITDTSRLIAYLNRPQRELPLLQSAREVHFSTDARPGRDYVADVDLIAPVVDPTTGSFRLRMRVRKEDTAELRPGMFLRARILTESTREALMVPKSAVLADGPLSVVFVVRGDTASKITLDPGLEERLHVECRNRGDDGVQNDDLLVTSGHERLKDQARVEIAKD